jgi:hypothetical protein
MSKDETYAVFVEWSLPEPETQAAAVVIKGLVDGPIAALGLGAIR